MAEQVDKAIDEITVDSFELPAPPAKKAEEYLDSYKGWVYSATTLIADGVSTVPMQLFKKIGDDEFEEVTDHQALDVLRFVNEFQTEQELREATSTYGSLLGEAVWILLREGSDEPTAIVPVRPDWIEIIPDGKGGVKKYNFHPSGIQSDAVGLDPEDVIFFKDFSPKDLYRGYGKVQAAAIDIDIDDFSDTWNRNFFFNSALPSIILTSDKKMNKESKKRFVRKWQANHGGKENSNKIAFFDGGGVDVKEVAANMQELDFQESKKRLMEKILSTFHVSKSNIGIVDDVNRANSEAQQARFMKLVVKPELVSFTGALNEFYLPMFDDTENMFFNFIDPVPEDRTAKLEELKIASQEGWMTTNEIRERLELDPLKGGDVIYKPFNLQVVGSTDDSFEEPTDTDDDVDETEEIQEDAKGFFRKIFQKRSGIKIVKLTRIKKAGKKRWKFGAPVKPANPATKKLEAQTKKMEHGVMKIMVELMKQRASGMKEEDPIMSTEERTEYWKQFVENTDKQEDEMKEILDPLANEQEKAVIAKIKKHSAGIGNNNKLQPSTFLFGVKKENQKWLKEFRPFIRGIVQDRGNDVIDELILDKQVDIFAMSTDAVIAYLVGQGMRFVPEVNRTTRDALLKTLAEGLKAQESVAEMVRRVTSVYEGLRGFRAERIARTEVLRSNNFATSEAYEQSGVVAAKQWLTSRDGRVRDAHAAADGQIVELDQAFEVGGEALKYPQDPAGSAENTIQCRCTMIPVTISQERGMQAKEKKEKETKVEVIVEKMAEEIVMKEINKQKALTKEIEVEKLAREVEIKLGKDALDTHVKDTKKRLKAKAEKASKERLKEDEAILKGSQERVRDLSRKKKKVIKQVKEKKGLLKTLTDRLVKGRGELEGIKEEKALDGKNKTETKKKQSKAEKKILKVLDKMDE